MTAAHRAGAQLRGRLPRVGRLVAIVFAAGAFAVIASRPSAPEVSEPTGDVAKAEKAIEYLLNPQWGKDPIAVLPDDFAEVSGHAAEHERAPDGTIRAVYPGGSCSSPWGNTRWDYGVGCRSHDLGYDLLRYAEKKGQPLSPELRERLDERLSKDMHAQCEYNPQGSAGACRIVASLYTVGLVVNSWHQRWGPPLPEPVGPWTGGFVVIALLVAVRLPATQLGRRGEPAPASPRRPRSATRQRSPSEVARGRYLGMLLIASMAGIVLAESILAFTTLDGRQPAWVWPLTWLLQLFPVFFLAGGYANLQAWRAVQASGHGIGGYLANRISWLLRPVLAFVTAWLALPLSLELLDAPADAIDAFGTIILQPLWLLGLYLLVAGATPVTHWLHRRAPVATPVVLLAVVSVLGVIGSGSVVAHAGGVAVALLCQQLAFHYADGTLWRIRRSALVGLAAVAGLGLVGLTTFGGHSKLLIAEPTEYASFAPSILGVLLIGLLQICLIALPRERATQAVAASRPARAIERVRARPMTAYLCYLCATVFLAGVIGAASTGGGPSTGTEWLLRPQTLLALALIAVPAALVFRWFERAGPTGHLVAPVGSTVDTIAAVVGVGYGALGLLGFAVNGFTGFRDTPSLFGLPLDPMANLIHVLLGWYLLHTARAHASVRPAPWLLAAIACVPPMITTVSGPGLVVHGVTIVGALAMAVLCVPPGRLLRTAVRREPAVDPVAG